MITLKNLEKAGLFKKQVCFVLQLQKQPLVYLNKLVTSEHENRMWGFIIDHLHPAGDKIQLADN